MGLNVTRLLIYSLHSLYSVPGLTPRGQQGKMETAILKQENTVTKQDWCGGPGLAALRSLEGQHMATGLCL